MTTDVVYVEDIGTEITLDSGEDLSDNNSVSIKVKKPDNSTAEWAGSVVETTKVQYVTEAGDLSVKGRYIMHIYLDLPSWQGHGERHDTMVARDLYT